MVVVDVAQIEGVVPGDTAVEGEQRRSVEVDSWRAMVDDWENNG